MDSKMNFLLKNNKLDWEKINGIVSDYYPLMEEFKRIHDISFDWKEDLKLEVLKLGNHNNRLLKKAKEIFEDLNQLQNDFKQVREKVFPESINQNSFNLICVQAKRIALILYNYDLINFKTYTIISKLKIDKLIKRKSASPERKYVTPYEKSSVICSLNKLISFFEEYHPDYVNYAKQILLKYHLSNMGLRISSINSIINSNIKDTGIEFKVFKKKTSEGYEKQFYPYAFIGKNYGDWLLELKDQFNPDSKFFLNVKAGAIGGLLKKFKYWAKKQLDNKEILDGWKNYLSWKKLTHSGRHGFIFECHFKGLRNDDIAAITLQNERIIENNYTKKMINDKKKVDAMEKFVNLDWSYKNKLGLISEHGLLVETNVVSSNVT